MGFTFDGDRSKRRLWFANKLHRQIKNLELLSKALVYDGFTFTVRNLDPDLKEGRVTAPMGLIVACSLEDSMTLLVADNWTGSITAKQDLKILKEFSDAVFGFADGVKKDESAYETILFDSLPREQYFKTTDAIITADSYLQEMPTPVPVLLPYKQAEGFWCGAGANFVADYTLDIFEYLLHFYESDGSILTSRTFTKLENTGTDYPGRVFMSLPATNFAVVYSYETSVPYEIVNITDVGYARFAAVYIRFTATGTMERDFFTLTDIFTGIPAELLAIISDTTTWSAATPLGSYAFSLAKDTYPTLLHACDLSGYIVNFQSGSILKLWFDDNYPDSNNWGLFYVIIENGINYTVNIGQFASILENIYPGVTTDNPPDINWKKALMAFWQLFPRPTPSPEVPHDSVMFHAEDGNIYVYTRKYGEFQISKTGITTTSFVVPSEVATTGTRPSITYAGNGTYLCVCENLVPPTKVYAVYYGSPFVGWTALPSVKVGFHLEYIRPVKVFDDGTILKIVLLGIMKDETTSDHYVAHLNYTGTESWNQLTKIPVTDAVRMNWDVCLFGNGDYVTELANYLDPPNIYYRMPVCSTYADYDQP